jgi:hypothetical protein
MQVYTIEDAPVLVPNKEHENFTRSRLVIPAGTELVGEPKNVDGKRRGEPFTYRLFYTNDNQIIHLKKVKPMPTTQVYLGADAKQTPTIVDVPPRQLFTTNTIIGAAIGGFVGNYIAKRNSYNKNLYMLGGAVAGFFVARYLQGRKSIKVVKSK